MPAVGVFVRASRFKAQCSTPRENNMKRLIPWFVSLVFCSSLVLAQQPLARLDGKSRRRQSLARSDPA
jgi:hypothetical protein